MKEHREPPPIVAEDSRSHSVAPAGSDRLARPLLGLPRPVRVGIDRRRVVFWLVILLGVLVCSYLAYLAARAARSWLGDQPAYQLPFRSIVLDPPPPPWYRGGAAAFLEDVRRRARMPETVPLLKLREAELKRVLKAESPWTEDVERVWYQPLGITVRINYRRPVALVEVSEDEKYLIDESGVILPLGDLDGDGGWLDEQRGLIRIKGRDLLGPLDPTPGLVWKPRPGATDASPGNRQIPAAARLASFLEHKLSTIDRLQEPVLNIRIINPMDKEGRGFFLWNSQSTIIQWGDAPGEEKAEDLTADEKWERLKEWSRRGEPKPVSDREFWKITAEGVKQKIVTEPPSPESARLAPPRRDRATIPAKAPGQ